MGEEKKGFFRRLVSGLTKTRDNIVSGMDSIFHGFSRIDDDFYEELEETLIMGDLGVRATMDIIEDLKEKVKEQHIKEPLECRQLLIDSIREQMDVGETAYEFENRTSVVFVIGVNGVGKTTTIGKLAGKLKDQNKKVILAAADTFRAAAGEQLREWANRAGVEMIGGQEGADPASVVYDAVAAAKARKADVLLCDTAGRLHNKKNLMEELKKINRVIDREYPDAFRETLVVLDATTGQNALVVVPILIFVSLEIAVSAISMKSLAFRNLIQGKPIFVIRNGKLDGKQMRRLRLTIRSFRVSYTLFIT